MSIVSELLMRLDGVNGQLELYEDKVVISRSGALAKMSYGFFKGDKTIYLNQISGIQLKPGTSFTSGYIQFTLPGGNEKTCGIFEATKDENSIMFYKRDNETAMRIKDRIEEIKNSEIHINSGSASVADELKKFKELLDVGVISQEEFTEQKRKLLSV